MKNLVLTLFVTLVTFQAFAAQHDDGVRAFHQYRTFIEQENYCVSSITKYSDDQDYCGSTEVSKCGLFDGIMGDSRTMYVQYGCTLAINTKKSDGSVGPTYPIGAFADENQDCKWTGNYSLDKNDIAQVRKNFRTLVTATQKLAWLHKCK